MGEAAMSEVGVDPDPGRIDTLLDLARAFDRLRRKAARPGQVRLSVRNIADRTKRPTSTLDPYLRGERLCPADVYEDILRALGVPNAGLRPWLDVWDRLADAADRRSRSTVSTRRPVPASRPQPLRHIDEFHYPIAHPGRVGQRVAIVAGDLRRVRCADVWVNPENTSMRMPRFEEYSTSAIIRYEGALRDETGQVTRDHIAEELTRKIGDRVPVAPGAAIVTGPGELARTNNVRQVVHVAAVHGEPGEGYRQILDIGRCVTNALLAVEHLNADAGEGIPALRSILFPLLGTGQGGGDTELTVVALLGAALDHLGGAPARHAVDIAFFLAYTDVELAICRRVFDRSAHLLPVEPAGTRHHPAAS
jgi:hypothetical protein